MKVLLVGLGSIAKKHINALLTIDSGVQIDALRSSKGASAFENVTNIFQLTKDKSYDFAIISTPTHLHYKNIEQLLILNIPLFIEKPLFAQIPEDDSLLSEVSRRNITTYIACNLRFLDCLNYVKNELIGRFRINEVNSYCGSFLPEWRPSVDYKTNYSARKDMGGGVHLDLIHEIDYLYWLLGKPREVKSILTSSSSIDITAFDYANYCLKYDDYTASVILNYYRRVPKRSLEILTDTDVYEVDLLENNIHKNGELIYASKQKVLDTYRKQLEFFIDEILPNQSHGFNDIFEAQHILKIALNEEIR